MNDLGLGKIIATEQRRDAIHVAVAPVTAAHRLAPGQDVGFIYQENQDLVGAGTLNSVGVVDPFLKQYVEKGQRFWMFLYPNTVTSLRHEWTHPAFKEEAPPFSAEHALKVAQLEADNIRLRDRITALEAVDDDDEDDWGRCAC